MTEHVEMGEGLGLRSHRILWLSGLQSRTDIEAKRKTESILGRTKIDMYSGYAVLRVPDQYTSLGLVQGSFQVVLKEDKKGAKGSKGEAAVDGSGRILL